MRKVLKGLTALCLTTCLFISLSGCGDSASLDAAYLVENNIAEIYLGEVTEDYLEFIDSTAEKSEQAYLEGLEVEAEFFANYWGIVDANYGEVYDDLNDSLKAKIVALYDEIYSHTKYEVQEAVKQDDTTYSVKVIVYPIDIMEQAYNAYTNDESTAMNAFLAKYSAADVNAMTDEEYATYTNEYGEAVVQMITDLLPSLGYMEEKSLVMQVEDNDNIVSINEDDWVKLDEYIIYYP